MSSAGFIHVAPSPMLAAMPPLLASRFKHFRREGLDFIEHDDPYRALNARGEDVHDARAALEDAGFDVTAYGATLIVRPSQDACELCGTPLTAGFCPNCSALRGEDSYHDG